MEANYAALLFLACVCGHALVSGEVLTLDGRSSYARFQYPPAAASTSWSVSYELRTESADGLVFRLVSQDRSSSVALQLLDSALVLTVSAGGGSNSSTVAASNGIISGTFLTWTIEQDAQTLTTSVKVLGSSPAQSVSILEAAADDVVQAGSGDVFIGGVGTHQIGELQSVPALVACVRDVRLAGASATTDASDFTGKSGSCDWCEASSCQAGSNCYPRAAAAGCDCGSTGKFGPTCSEDAIVATFSGDSRWSHDFGSVQSEYCRGARQQDVHMQLRTTAAAAGSSTVLQLVDEATADGLARLTLRIDDAGKLTAAVSGGDADGNVSVATVASTAAVNDGAWHRVHVRVGGGGGGDVVLTVDDVAASSAAGLVRTCLAGRLTAGGDAATPYGRGFVGCLRGLRLDRLPLFDPHYRAADERRRDVVHYRRPLLAAECEARLQACPAPGASPLSLNLVDPQSGVSFAKVSMATHGKLEFWFVLEEPSGLLFSAHGTEDYIFMQIEDGKFCLLARAGSGSGLKICSERSDYHLNSSVSHTVVLVKHRERISVAVDGVLVGNATLANATLHLDHELVWGRRTSPCGAPTPATGPRSVLQNPPDLKDGFRGCLGALVMNGLCVGGLEEFTCKSTMASAPNSTTAEPGGIFKTCRNQYCDTNFCKNEGACVSRLTRFTCNCRETGYIGASCETPGPTLTFYGGETVRRNLGSVVVTEMFFLYRAWEQVNVTLATAYNAKNEVAIRLSQAGDTVKCFFKNDGGETGNLEVNYPGLSTAFDYHKVKVRISSDDASGFVAVALIVKKLGTEAQVQTADVFDVITLSRVVYGANVTSDSSAPPGAAAFRGHMREAVVNDVDITGELSSGSGDVVSEATRGEFPFSNYTTFFATAKVAKHVALLRPLERISFRFRTPVADDAVLFDAGVVTLLVKRRRIVVLIRSVADNDESQVRAFVREASKLNDRQWHSIEIFFNHTSLVANISVDGHLETLAYLNSKVLNVDTVSFGGALAAARYAVLPVQSGYVGCVEDVWINGAYVDMYKTSNVNKFSDDDLERRCPMCKPLTPCYNGGVCLDNMDDTFTCDCSGTGFVGAQCLEEATTATMQSNSTMTLDIDSEEATPRSLVFLYRSWMQGDDAVNLATLRTGDGKPSVVVQQTGDGIRILTKSSTSDELVTAAVLAIANISEFVYKKVSLTFPKPGDAGATFNVSIDATTGPMPVAMPTSPLQLSSIEFGLPLRGAAAAGAGDDAGKPLSGHLRDVEYNHYGIVTGYVAGSDNVTSNATVGEVVFSEYVVHYLAAGSRHELARVVPIGSVAFALIPNNMNVDSVLLDVDGGEYGSMQLLVRNGALELRLANDPDYQPQSTSESLRVESHEKWTPVSVAVDAAATTARMTVGAASKTVSFPAGFDPAELLAISVGGVSERRLAELRNATSASLSGFVGCVKSLSVNGDSAELLPTNAVDVNDTVATVLGDCLACNVFNSTCKRGGRCVDEEALSFTCDCSLTGFSGPRCTEKPITVTLNGTGSIVYNVTSSPASSADEPGFDVSFFYRLWQRPAPAANTVLATVSSAGGDAYQIVHQENERIALVLVTAAGARSELGAVAFAIGELSATLEFRYTSVRLQQHGPRLQLSAGRGSGEFVRDGAPFRTASVEIGLREASADASPPIGHVRQIVVDAVQILTGEQQGVRVEGVAIAELPFDPYTVSFADRTVGKTVVLGDRAVASVALAMRVSELQLRSADDWSVLEVAAGNTRFALARHDDDLVLRLSDTASNAVAATAVVRFDKSSAWQRVRLAIGAGGATLQVGDGSDSLVWSGSIDPGTTRAGGNSVTVGRAASGTTDGFLGCVQSLFINDEFQDLQSVPVSGLAADVDQDDQTAVVNGCPLCQFVNPCHHGGVCRDLPADTTECDCDTTAYQGEKCGKRATTATMFGNTTVTYAPSAPVPLTRAYLYFRQSNASSSKLAVLARLQLASAAAMPDWTILASKTTVELREGDDVVASLDIGHAGDFPYSFLLVDFALGTAQLSDVRKLGAKDAAFRARPDLVLKELVVPAGDFVGHLRELTVNAAHVLDDKETDLGGTLLAEMSFKSYPIMLVPDSSLSFEVAQAIHSVRFDLLVPSDAQPQGTSRIVTMGTGLGDVSLLVVGAALKVGVAVDDAAAEVTFDLPFPSVLDNVRRAVRVHANRLTRVIRVTVAPEGGAPAHHHLNTSHLALPSNPDATYGEVLLGRASGNNEISTICIEDLYVNDEPQNLHKYLAQFGFPFTRTRDIKNHCPLCMESAGSWYCRHNGSCSREQDGRQFCSCVGTEYFGDRCAQSALRFTFNASSPSSLVAFPPPDTADPALVTRVQFTFRAWDPLSTAAVVALLSKSGQPVAWISTDVHGVWLHLGASPDAKADRLLAPFPRHPAPLFRYLAVDVRVEFTRLSIAVDGRRAEAVAFPSPTGIYRVQFGRPLDATIAEPFRGHLKNVLVNGKRLVLDGPDAGDFLVEDVEQGERAFADAAHFSDSLISLPIPAGAKSLTVTLLVDAENSGDGDRTVAALHDVTGRPILEVTLVAASQALRVTWPVGEQASAEDRVMDGDDGLKIAFVSASDGFDSRGGVVVVVGDYQLDGFNLLVGKASAGAPAAEAFVGCVRHAYLDGNAVDLVTDGKQLGPTPAMQGCPVCRIEKLCKNSGVCAASSRAQTCECKPENEGDTCEHGLSFATFYGNGSLLAPVGSGARSLSFSYRPWLLAKLTHVAALLDGAGDVALIVQETDECVRVSYRDAADDDAWRSADVLCDAQKLGKFEYRNLELRLWPRQATRLALTLDGEPSVSVDVVVFDAPFRPYAALSLGVPPPSDRYPKDAAAGQAFVGHVKRLMVDSASPLRAAQSDEPRPGLVAVAMTDGEIPFSGSRLEALPTVAATTAPVATTDEANKESSGGKNLVWLPIVIVLLIVLIVVIVVVVYLRYRKRREEKREEEEAQRRGESEA